MSPTTRSVSAGKRNDIVLAAESAFIAKGYSQTTMEYIATAAKVSTKTLYGHFANKPEVLGEVIDALCHRIGPNFLESAPPFGAPELVLATIAEQFLARMYDPSILRVLRLVISEADTMPEIGATVWRTGPEPTLKYVQAYLKELDRQGVLAVPDPKVAASDFMAACLGFSFLPTLLAVESPPKPRQLNARVKRVVKQFMLEHAPTPV